MTVTLAPRRFSFILEFPSPSLVINAEAFYHSRLIDSIPAFVRLFLIIGILVFFKVRCCIFTNKKHIIPVRPTVLMSVFDNLSTVLDQIWRECFLLTPAPRHFSFIHNTPSLFGYKYHCFHRSGLMVSISSFAFLFFVYPLTFKGEKVMFLFIETDITDNANRKLSFYSCFTDHKRLAHTQIKKAL